MVLTLVALLPRAARLEGQAALGAAKIASARSYISRATDALGSSGGRPVGQDRRSWPGRRQVEQR
jgi:hypothetical protein